MKIIKAITISFVIAGFYLSAVAAMGQTVTLESLLQEMTNRDASAQWPVPDYICKQVTSHDPRKKNPADPAGWHSNQDYGNFIRMETNADRPEWVILDAHGPGAITRIWVPLSADKDNQVIRFYLDGSSQPAIAVKFNELLSGKSFVRPPLAFVSWNETDLRRELRPDYKAPRGVGGDLYLPIPFAKSCKVTLDQVPFYYSISYRQYDDAIPVKTFTMADYRTARDTVDAVAEGLLDGPRTVKNTLTKETMLAPGKQLELALPGGPAAVRQVQVQVVSPTKSLSPRSLVLEATFDGEPTVWCPLSEFFGTGVHWHPVRDWYRNVSKDHVMSAYWVMPYQKKARIALKNVGSESVKVRLSANVGAWKWDNQSLFFHASWHSQHGIKTRPRFDWNYLKIHGRGSYVGDTLTVFSPSPKWYGEGDERIYLDGESLPSHIGTGTEDYYGYAWGMPNFFDSPFMSAPERDSSSRSDWRGYTTDSRLRVLDAMPFRNQLQHDMEIWDWADTQVDYAVGTFWYARPGAECNRAPQPGEAATGLKTTTRN